MMSYYKLVEMNNNGVTIRIDNAYTSRTADSKGRQWAVSATKTADGVSLNITHECEDLDEGIDDIYNKWAKATGQGMPEHKLNILEHHKAETEQPNPLGDNFEDDSEDPPLDRRSFDDEIPF